MHIGISLALNRLGGASSFSPSDITSLLAWYDPSDATTITDTGGLVDQLDDKSGNGAHLTQSSAARPTTGTRTQNSLNVLDCNISDYMTKSAFAVPASGDIAIFMVAQIDVVDATSDSIVSMDATNDFQFTASSATQFDGQLNTTGIGSNVNLTGGPFAGPSIYNINFDFTSGFYNAFIDGVQRGANETYTAKLDASQELIIFSNRAKINYPDGAFGEIIICEDCTASARQDIEAYLGAKWGISV